MEVCAPMPDGSVLYPNPALDPEALVTAGRTHDSAIAWSLAKYLSAIAVAALALYVAHRVTGLDLVRRTRSLPLGGSELERVGAGDGGQTRTCPENIIIVIADGLGFAHLSAGRAVLHGLGGGAAWDRFPETGWHRPRAAEGFIVDSAASATALATGVPTRRGAIGVDVDGVPLTTLFERAATLGYRTGIVTDSYIWDATVAAFVTHSKRRDDAESILRQLAESSLEILVGEIKDAGIGRVPSCRTTMEILEERFRVAGPGRLAPEELLSQSAEGAPVAAVLKEGQLTDLQSTPTLPLLLEMTLERLSSDERPFLLLVESEEADSASHDNDLERLLRGIEVLEAVLGLVLDFADEDGRTLVVFTADHETGGLTLTAGRSNRSLQATWSTGDHSGVVVPVLAAGPGSVSFVGTHATWELGRLLDDMLCTPAAHDPGGGNEDPELKAR